MLLDISVLSQQIINTFPALPDNVLATGYYGLQLTFQIDQPDGYQICRWKYEGKPTVEIFTPGLQCRNRSDTGTNFSLTCVNENNVIVTSLIVNFPVQSQVIVYAECGKIDGQPYEKIANISLIVAGNK